MDMIFMILLMIANQCHGASVKLSTTVDTSDLEVKTMKVPSICK